MSTQPEYQTNSDMKTKVIKEKMDKRRTLFSTDKKPIDTSPLFGIIPLSVVDLAKQNGIIIAVVIGCWISSFLNIGLAGMIIVGAFMSRYFSNSLSRTTRNLKAEIEKAFISELVNFQNDQGTWTNGEHVEWLNIFIEKYWSMFEPVLSEIIVGVVDPYLELYKPAFLDDLKFKEFSLGSNGVRIRSIEMNRDVEDDIIYMAMNMIYAPVENNADANSNIIMEIRLGKGLASGAIPVSVRDTSFEGKLHCRIKLMTKFPHVKVVEVWFDQLPRIDFVLKPLGKIPLDIMNLPGIKDAIQMIINMVLNSILVSPLRMPIDVDAILNGVQATGPIGVLKVHLHRGANLKNTELIGKSDSYCDFLLNGRLVATTDVFENDLNPLFDELKFILIYDLHLDKLTFNVLDHDQVGFKTVGKSDFFLLEHLETPQFLDREAVLYNPNKEPRGELYFDSFFFPTEGHQGASPTSTASNTVISSGILHLNLHQCKQLLGNITSLTGTYNPYIEVTYNNDLVFKSKVKKRSNNPRFEESLDLFISNIHTGKLSILVKDQRDLSVDPLIASKSFSVPYMLNKSSTVDWYELDDCKSGKIYTTWLFKPVYLSPSDLSTILPASYVLILVINGCKSLTNKELSGTSDPYIQVKSNSKLISKTRTISNTLNPVYNHVIYLPIRTNKEIIQFDIFDFNQLTKDKLMAQLALNIGKDITMTNPIHGDVPLGPKDGVISLNAHLVPVSQIPNNTANMVYLVIHEFTKLTSPHKYHFQVHVDEHGVQYSSKIKSKTENPIFEESFDVFTSESNYSIMFIKLFHGDDCVGTAGIHVNQLNNHNSEYTIDLISAVNPNLIIAQCSLSAYLSPVAYATPIRHSALSYGQLMINIKSASNLGQGEFLGGCDPYVTVFNSNTQIIKTEVHKKQENPQFNESISFNVHLNQLELRIECRDFARIGPHKLFGNIITPDLTNLANVHKMEDIYDLGKNMNLTVQYQYTAMPESVYSNVDFPVLVPVKQKGVKEEVEEELKKEENQPAKLVNAVQTGLAIDNRDINDKVDVQNKLNETPAMLRKSREAQMGEHKEAPFNKSDPQSDEDAKSIHSVITNTTTAPSILDVANSSGLGHMIFTLHKIRHYSGDYPIVIKLTSTYGINGTAKKHASTLYKTKEHNTQNIGEIVEMGIPDPKLLKGGVKYRWIIGGAVSVANSKTLLSKKTEIGEFKIDLWQFVLEKIEGHAKEIGIMEDMWVSLGNGVEVLVNVTMRVTAEMVILLLEEKETLMTDVVLQKSHSIFKMKSIGKLSGSVGKLNEK